MSLLDSARNNNNNNNNSSLLFMCVKILPLKSIETEEESGNKANIGAVTVVLVCEILHDCVGMIEY